jgi:two-component system chemotaxis sensor kinase CheA
VQRIAEAEEQFDALVGDPAALDRIRTQGYWPDLPTIAVTDWPEDTQAEGLTAVLPRSDRSALIATLDEVSQEEKAA